MKKRLPPVLPCQPCPHDSICCRYGTMLVGDEPARIAARFGAQTFGIDALGAQRTKVVNGRCVFHANGGCTLHDEPEYPLTCRRFPWRDGEDETLPYQYDLDICPELTNDMDRGLEGQENP